MYPYVLIKMVGRLRLSGHELFEMSVPGAVNETAMPKILLAPCFLRRDLYRSVPCVFVGLSEKGSASHF